jgi:hypothetical protein
MRGIHMLRVAIVTGSTRPGRNNEAVARWVYDLAKQRSDAEFELVDIATYHLPLLDEAVSPIMGQYSPAHTKEAIMTTPLAQRDVARVDSPRRRPRLAHGPCGIAL